MADRVGMSLLHAAGELRVIEHFTVRTPTPQVSGICEHLKLAEEHISAAMQRIEEEIEPLLRKAQAAIRRAEKGKGSVRQDALEDADDALVDILKILPRQIGDES